MGAKINDLLDPLKKMSKSSENPNGVVFVNDDRDAIIKKFKRAVTDSGAEIKYDPAAKPGVSNLLSIYSVCLLADKQYLDDVLKTGAERAAARANKTLAKVYKKIGFYRF